jgi:hypothetical protein
MAMLGFSLTSCVNLALAVVSADSPPAISHVPVVFGIPIEFILFALTLLGVALFHHHTLKVALSGLLVITAYKLGFSFFTEAHIAGFRGFEAQLHHEWVTLANLFGLLLGFDILAHHFSSSHIPALLPRFLPDDWKGGFVLLLLVFVLSAFLDNIAAAMIGGTIAASVYRGRVHVGFIAAIVAASNAGGCGSVVGDTTTTMMWISGISPVDVLGAYTGAIAAFAVFSVIAAVQQQRYQPISADPVGETKVDIPRVGVVLTILTMAIAANVVINSFFTERADDLPWIGMAVWLGIVLTAPIRRPHWGSLVGAARGACFLLSLVLAASMMPVEDLPRASANTAFGLGAVSAVFDNIPLTKLAIEQGGYDWGLLAYCVGFGGSMIWFGSSAGVAISSTFAQARSVGNWLRHGWHVALGYVIGFAVFMLVHGFHAQVQHQAAAASAGTISTSLHQ